MEGSCLAGGSDRETTVADGISRSFRQPRWRERLSRLLALVLPLLLFAWFGGHSGHNGWAAVAAVSLPETPEALEGGLWVGSAGGLLKLDPLTGGPQLGVADVGEIRALTTDPLTGRLWALGRDTLFAVDADGAVAKAVSLPGPGAGGPVHAAVAVNGVTGHVWVMQHKRLAVLDRNGELLGQWELADPVRALALESDRDTAWVATAGELAAWNSHGPAGPAIALGPGFNAQSLAFDPGLDALWVAGTNALRRYGRDGTLQYTKSRNGIRQIAVDGAGGLWVTDATWLRLLDASGLERIAAQPLHGIGDLQALAVDPSTGAAWVAGEAALREVLPEGTMGQAVELAVQPGFRGRVWGLALYADTVPPEITILRPEEGAFEGLARPEIEVRYGDVGSGVDPNTLELSVDHRPVTADCVYQAETASCIPQADLAEGGLTLRAWVSDRAGNTSPAAERRFTVDTVPPVILLESPGPDSFTNEPMIWLRGTVSEPATLTVAGEPVALGLHHDFDHAVALVEGGNVVSLVATDRAGNVGELEIHITLDTVPPPPVSVEVVELVEGSGGMVTVTGGPGSAEPGAEIGITNVRTGVQVSAPVSGDGGFMAPIAASAGDPLELVVIDRAGNRSLTVSFQVPGGGSEGVPGDPAGSAPALPPGEVTGLKAATAFLYSGPSPVQRDVAPGAIAEHRAAVVRGRVATRTGDPLPGVRISVKGQPALGHTLSRNDGVFDLVVNGGGNVAVRYDRPGYLPVQRVVRVPWDDYVWAPDVVMIPLDPVANPVDLSAGVAVQAARGSVVSDADGTRQATILFPQGTGAELVFADGTTEPIAQLTVRATEYTVGDSGLAAMPGELPPTSGYTYAVELSVDEAIARGATEVRFDRPLPVYVENFLEFSVGGIVPAGWYDRDRAAWIPSDNGRVIRVLAVEGDLAVLDVTGAGLAATGAQLAELGIHEAERRALAGLYAAGQSLWRIPTEHFTPWDYNWPYGPPDDAQPPRMPDPEVDEREDDPDCRKGSIIECQNQVLGQSVGVAGTPFTLNYRSDRVPGRSAARSMQITLSGASLPSSLQRIELQVQVAGRHFHQAFAPEANQSHTFVWDGRDAYGRELLSAQPATVRVGYVYRAVYYAPANFSRSFAATGLGILSGDRRRHEITLWQEFQTTLGALDARGLGFGGWSLDVHHVYDASREMLYRGDGGRHSAQDQGQLITTVAGNGQSGNSGDGGPALQAGINGPYDVAMAPDGTLFLAAGDRVRKVDPQGIISTVPGTSGNSGVFNVAVDANGAVFFTRRNGGPRIFRAAPDGSVHHVAGNGASSFAGDGGPAVNASFIDPRGMAVGADGSLYVGDFRTHRVRRIGPDGIIRTVAGNGGSGITGIGGPAVHARIDRIYDVAVGPEGDLYIDSHNYTVFRVGPDGIIHRAAGRGCNSFSGDGGDATLACMGRVSAVTVSAQGAVAIADIIDNRRIRLVTPDGIIRTVAGNGRSGFAGDDGPAERATIGGTEISFGPDGNLYLADTANRRVRRIGSGWHGPLGSTQVVSSRDGVEHYVFDHAGRHLQTIDSVTGAVRFRFGYDTRGMLAEVEDGHGNRTAIERDAAGRVVAIVAPHGQRSGLSLDADGYLGSVANPLGETHRFDYGAEGLLMRLTDPRGYASMYAYDAQGRLLGTQDAAGGGWTLVRESAEPGYEVRMTSAEGNATRYRVQRTPAGGGILENFLADGTRERVTRGTAGNRHFLSADGTVAEIVEAPDPRFGMGSPVPANTTVRTPGGRVLQMAAQRSAVLDSADNPMSHRELTEALTINGRTTQARFVRTDGRWQITSPQGRNQSVELDQTGRIRRMEVPGMAPVTYTYDDGGRLEQVSLGYAGERSLHLVYDGAGHVAETIDALSRRRSYRYDAAGRVVSESLPDGREIGYVHDRNGNLAALLPPGREAHRFEYTPVNLEQSYLPPALPGVEAVTHYRYDRDRRLTAVERPGGETVEMSYDSAGRLQSTRIAAGEYRYGYDSAGGQLASVSGPGGVGLAYAWDGFLPVQEVWTGPVAGAVGHGYDDNFWLTQELVNGQSIAFGYDNDGLLVQAGALFLTRDAQHGWVTGTLLGPVETAWEYNAFGEPIRIRSRSGSGVLAEFGYLRDALGRVLEEEVLIDGTTQRTAYTYDVAGRLASVSRDGVTVSYGYDANGNRTHVNGVPVATHDGQDRMLSYGTAQFEYTQSGELRSRTDAEGRTDYVYDELGNLRQVRLADGRTIDYLIDGRNRRVGKRVNGDLVQGFLYRDQLNPVAELDGQGQVLSRFVYGERGHVPAYMIREGVTYRIIADQLGSPRLVVDVATGAVVQRVDYDAWGNVLNDTNPGFQPFGFAGGLRDMHTGLVRFGARDYDPVTGRWTAKDPIRFEGGDPNLYGYAFRDPVNLVDLEGELPYVAAGAGIGFAAGIAGAWVTGVRGWDLVGYGVTGALMGAATAAAPWLGGALAGAAANGSAQLFNIFGDRCKTLADFNVGAVIGSAIGGRMAFDRVRHLGTTWSERLISAKIGFEFDAAYSAVGGALWSRQTQ